MPEKYGFPDADAPSIIRANQKDAYFESVLKSKLGDAIQVVKGSRFLHSHPEEISVFTKAIYLGLTSLVGTRTLGEEYCDLFYVSRNGNKLPNLFRRAGFIISFAILPYAIKRFIKFIKTRNQRMMRPSELKGWTLSRFAKYVGGTRLFGLISNASYAELFTTLSTAHLAFFYFFGRYYQLSKRIFGLRYASGHPAPKEQEGGSGYELLGILILFQIGYKACSKAYQYIEEKFPEQQEFTIQDLIQTQKEETGVIRGAPTIEINNGNNNENDIDLSDPSVLSYIPEESRKCTLCLSYITNPSATPCGHIFCWDCINDWCRERPECPLCRQAVFEYNLLPIR